MTFTVGFGYDFSEFRICLLFSSIIPIDVNILCNMKHHGNMEARTNVYIKFRSLKMVNSFLSGKKFRAN